MVEIHHKNAGEVTAAVTVTAYGNITASDSQEIVKCSGLPNYLSFDGNGIDLDDVNKTLYGSGDFLGFVSETASNSEASFEGITPAILLRPETSVLDLKDGVTLRFYGNCCSEVFFGMYSTDGTQGYSYTETVEIPEDDESLYWIPTAENTECSQLEIIFKKTVLPYQTVKVSALALGKQNYLTDIKSIELLEEISILSDDLPINSLNATVVCEDSERLKSGDELKVYSNNKYYGSFYIDEIDRTDRNVYEIKALNCVNTLENISYLHGGADFELNEFVATFHSETGVWLTLADGLDAFHYHVFGEMLVQSYRKILCLIAFACRFMIDSSRSNKISFKTLPKTVTSVITEENERIIGQSKYKKSTPISLTKTKIAETNFASRRETVNFGNAANTRTLVYFDEEMYVPLEQDESVIIYDRSTAYIDFISTTADADIIVSKYNYEYNNINISNPNITVLDKTNEKDFSSLQLRGFYYNGDDETVRLDYLKQSDIQKYMMSPGTVSAKIRLRNERVGDLVQIETPFDGIKTGIITSMNIHFGYEDTADIEVYEWSL